MENKDDNANKEAEILEDEELDLDDEGDKQTTDTVEFWKNRAFKLQRKLKQTSKPEKPEQPKQKVQTFTGQVVKAKNGRYALLTDKTEGKGFYLDDQNKAKQFDGQNVKVTGELDVATNTIHVSDIEPA